MKHVTLELDRTKKTKDKFNTAHFAEKELRPGEPLKPMILNATNSKTMKQLTGSAFIEDWSDVRITVYVETGVKFGKDTVDGLRISPRPPGKRKLTPENAGGWANAKAAFKRDGNLVAVLSAPVVRQSSLHSPFGASLLIGSAGGSRTRNCGL